MGGQAPQQKKLNVIVPAFATAVDGTQIVGLAPFAGSLIAAKFVPAAAMTGNTTNGRKIDVVNKGQAGAGTAIAATLTFATGVNGVAFDAKDVTLSGTAADRLFAEGDVVVYVSTHTGTGIADPGGVLELTFDLTV